MHCHKLVVKIVERDRETGRQIAVRSTEEMAADAMEKCEGTRLSHWKCVSWREVRNGGAVVRLSVSRSLCVRVKGNMMSGGAWGGGSGVHWEEDHTW